MPNIPNRPKIFESKETDPEIARALWKSKFPDEEQKMIFEMTIKRAKGQVTDEDWNKFMLSLKLACKS